MNRRSYLAALTASGSLMASGCTAFGRVSTGEPPACPPYPEAWSDGEGQTICDGAEDAPVYLTAEAASVAGSGGSIPFRFVNESETEITYGPDLWTLYQRTPTEWEVRIPIAGYLAAEYLPAGESRTFTLDVGGRTNCESDLPPQYATCELDPGRYMFGMSAETPDGTEAIFFASFEVIESRERG